MQLKLEIVHFASHTQVIIKQGILSMLARIVRKDFPKDSKHTISLFG
jgi:hypothetical protein